MESKICAGNFKAKCLQLLNEIAERRETLVITKRGKSIARVIPVEREQPLFGALRGSVVVEYDIISPTGSEWEAATLITDDQLLLTYGASGHLKTLKAGR